MSEAGILKRMRNSRQERQSLVEWDEIRNDKQGLIKWEPLSSPTEVEFYWGCYEKS